MAGPFLSGFKKGCAAKDITAETLMPDPRNAPYLQYTNLLRYPQLRHATFTRRGGTSHPPYDTLNISRAVGDSDENVAQNMMIIKHTMDAPRILSTEQTHGTEILVADANTTEFSTGSQQADAMITNVPGTGLIIKQADCQAVILFDPVKNVIANVHCGWKGNVKNILGLVVGEMTRHFHCNPQNFVAAVGPSLGPCCAEFVTHKSIFPADFIKFRVSENHFDLWRLSAHQLAVAGVDPKNITISKICTRCNTDRFFSYRGERLTGRFGTLVMLE